MIARLGIIILLILVLTVSLSPVGCRPAPILGEPVRRGKAENGTYEGTFRSWPNRAVVNVTIVNGLITDVRIVSHWASSIGRKAEQIIPRRIIEKQSTNVDAVSGATNSSRVIMNAAQNAIEKSYGSQ
ncbi:MAG TPA: FMN-binding protein [Nitrospirota bacterium]|nr:FMN-binding protein [Nitrospirota bacterium]